MEKMEVGDGGKLAIKIHRIRDRVLVLIADENQSSHRPPTILIISSSSSSCSSSPAELTIAGVPDRIHYQYILFIWKRTNPATTAGCDIAPIQLVFLLFPWTTTAAAVIRCNRAGVQISPTERETVQERNKRWTAVREKRERKMFESIIIFTSRKRNTIIATFFFFFF